MSSEKHVTEPDHRGYQVRIVRKGKEYSRYFSHNSWGSKKKSLEAAVSWRDQQLAFHGKKIKSLVSSGALVNNKSTGVRGVTKSISYDKRRDVHYLVYQVHWQQKGVVKNRKFQVGLASKVTADQELHTFRTALHFRKAYELSVEKDIDFYPEWYVNWKTSRLYEEPVEMASIPKSSDAVA